jgi:hypothetical protein
MTRLLVRRDGESNWRTPEVSAYDNESMLQELLAESPKLLPGLGTCSVATAIEFEIPDTGYADLVVVDAGGRITIVECKLKANSAIRRQVVGQVFAYAAGLATMQYPQFDAEFTRSGKMSIAEQLAVEEAEHETIRDAITQNLETGRFRLIIAVDEITPELQRVVRYINHHTKSDVDLLAIELRYVRHADVEILVPEVYGQESAAEKQLPPIVRNWSEEEVLITLEQNLRQDGMTTFNRLREFLLSRGGYYVHGKAQKPSGTYRVPVGSGTCPLVAIYTSALCDERTDRFSIAFGNLTHRVSEQQLAEFKTAISQIGPFDPYLKRADGSPKSYPEIPIEGVLTSNGVGDAVEKAIDQLIRDSGVTVPR